MPRDSARGSRPSLAIAPTIITAAREPTTELTESLPADQIEDRSATSARNGASVGNSRRHSRAAGCLRETLILRLVEGMTGPEIAARTGLTPGSVRVNLHRGMQQLREKLGASSVEGLSIL